MFTFDYAVSGARVVVERSNRVRYFHVHVPGKLGMNGSVVFRKQITANIPLSRLSGRIYRAFPQP